VSDHGIYEELVPGDEAVGGVQNAWSKKKDKVQYEPMKTSSARFTAGPDPKPRRNPFHSCRTALAQRRLLDHYLDGSMAPTAP